MSFFHDIRLLLSFLHRWLRGMPRTRLAIAFVILAGIVSGLSNAALIALINSVFRPGGPTWPIVLWIFVGLCVLVPVTRFASGAVLLRLAARAVREMRVQLSRRILAARLRTLEELGPDRLLATLTEDVRGVINALTNLPMLIMQAFIVIGALVYLWWLSWPTFLVVTGFMVIGVVTYQVAVRGGMRSFRQTREAWDVLMEGFRAVIEGAKELKLHFGRRRAFFSTKMEPAAEVVRRHSLRGQTVFLAATSWGHVLFFVLVGLVLFGMPRWIELDAGVLTGYTLAILYMMAPLEGIMNALPTLGQAAVSIEKIDRLGLSLLESGGDSLVAASASEPPEWPDWDRLRLVGVGHTYRSDAEERDFTLGPLDLTVPRGQLLFVAGGNGSGKTTLVKLLCGLYVPESGRIELGPWSVDDATREAYRQQFTTVFSEFYLFDRLLGLEAGDEDEKAAEYLAKLRLEHKVAIEDGRLSTLDLSRGQRKRLALLAAYLEDRPVYVFDEWAADQDPEFRAFFYRRLLPELKARGKTTIVISHDDQYYEVADRVVRMNYGEIEEQTATAGGVGTKPVTA
jgi:putative pyoverdin transport system ATP-binding/permease protein